MQRRTLRLAPLELLQTLHDGAIGQALLVLNSGDATLLEILDLIPYAAGLLLVLRRSEGELIATPIVSRLVRLVRILLRRLDDGRARRNQI